MGNPQRRAEDAGVSSYTYNNLNQFATGDWTGTISAFGWTRTEGLASLAVADGAQTVPATVLEPGEWTAKTLAANAGTNTYTVTCTANDTTTAAAQTTVTRPANQTSYTHDADGEPSGARRPTRRQKRSERPPGAATSMLANGGWAYAWNNENRLASATCADGLQKLEFVYDFQGRRRIKRVYSRATTNDPFVLAKTTLFVYDGWLLLQERATDHVAATTTTRTYLHGLDLSGQLGGEGVGANTTAGGIGGMLAVTTTRSGTATTSSLLYLYDGNGNVAALVDPVTTESAAAYEYSPFGRTLVAHGPLAAANPFRFSAKYTDTETGLVYYGYRYYEPGLGRWINRDPTGETGGENLFLFVGNSVASHFDYLGLKDRTDDISSKYKDVNNDGNPANDMTVTEKVANIVADIYEGATSFEDFAADMRDTFTNGDKWPPGNGRTTFGFLEADGAEHGFNEGMKANRKDFHRHLGAAIGSSWFRAFIYFSGDGFGGWCTDISGNNPDRATEQYSEAIMDSSFYHLGQKIKGKFPGKVPREDIYKMVLDMMGEKDE